jgi:hypothetical protein
MFQRSPPPLPHTSADYSSPRNYLTSGGFSLLSPGPSAQGDSQPPGEEREYLHHSGRRADLDEDAYMFTCESTYDSPAWLTHRNTPVALSTCLDDNAMLAAPIFLVHDTDAPVSFSALARSLLMVPKLSVLDQSHITMCDLHDELTVGLLVDHIPPGGLPWNVFCVFPHVVLFPAPAQQSASSPVVYKTAAPFGAASTVLPSSQRRGNGRPPPPRIVASNSRSPTTFRRPPVQ